MTDSPRLSIIVVPIDAETGAAGREQLRLVLEAVEGQTAAGAEIIVPHSRGSGINSLSTAHPRVIFAEATADDALAATAKAERLRAAAVDRARGEIIALIEDHVRPEPGWAAAILEEHCQPFSAIGGAVENGVDRPANWAAYFADLGRYHNPIPAAASQYASVVNVSYKRAALERIRPVWLNGFNETEVHRELLRAGGSIALSPRIVVRQYRGVRFGRSLGEFFAWGKCYGCTRARLVPGKRWIYFAVAPLIPGVLLIRSGLDAWRKKRLFGVWRRCLPLLFAFHAAWACGEASGYLHSSGGSR